LAWVAAGNVLRMVQYILWNRVRIALTLPALVSVMLNDFLLPASENPLVSSSTAQVHHFFLPCVTPHPKNKMAEVPNRMLRK